ncbi:MAG: AMP-binding protein [Cyanobacteriota bacterium]
MEFFSGLSPSDAVGLLDDLKSIEGHLAPVNRIPEDKETISGAVWTRDSLAQQQSALQARFENRDLMLLKLPNDLPQRHLQSDLCGLPGEIQGYLEPDQGNDKPERTSVALRLAITHGDAPFHQDNFPRNLSEALDHASVGTGSVTYVTASGVERYTYAKIKSQALSILGGLQQSVNKEREIVLVDMRDAQLAVPALFACFLGNLIPVPIMLPGAEDEEAAFDRLINALNLLTPSVVLASGLMPPRSTVATPILELSGLIACEYGDCSTFIDPAETALIILTSGSSGAAKGVHQSHQALLAMIRNFSMEANGLCADDRMMNWMPLDHIGSLAFSLFGAVATGIPFVHIDTHWILEQPARWVAIASQERSTITWFPNFAFRLIAEHAPAEGSLSSMRRLISGGEAVQAGDIEYFLERLAPLGLRRDETVAPSFGMSETCSGISLSLGQRFIGPYACLGRPTADTSLRIVDDQANILLEGEVGHLHVRSCQLFLRYHKQEASPLTSDGWFDTGDLGFLEAGSLYLTGRSKDVLNINGSKYFPQEIEEAARAVPGIDPNCLVALAYAPQGFGSEMLVILFAPLIASALHSDLVVSTLSEGIRAAVGAKKRLAVRHCLPCLPEDLPRSSIGKINRSMLHAALAGGQWDNVIRRMERLTHSVSFGLHRLVCKKRNASLLSHPHSGIDIFLNITTEGSFTIQGDAPKSFLCAMADAASEVFPTQKHWAYAKLLAAAQALSNLTETLETVHVEVICEEFTDAEAAPIATLVRSLDLSQPHSWTFVRSPASFEEWIERVTVTPSRQPSMQGFWLVAGGLGGIGSHLLSSLDSEGNAILCLGRTPEDQLPPDRRDLLTRLQRVIYLAGDLRDPHTLRSSVSRGMEGFGQPLAGIILAAGTGLPCTLAEETLENYSELADTLLTGFESARALVMAQPGAVLTIIGSVVGLLGGRSHGYAAAHASLLAAAREAISQNSPVSYIGFSSWSDTGLSAGTTNKALLARDGLQPLAVETGQLIVNAARVRPGTLWFAGMDDMHPAIASLSASACLPLVQAVAAIQDLDWPGAVPVMDALGRQVLLPARSFPSGSDPRSAWIDVDSRHVEDQSPATAVERVIADEFKSVLGIEQVDRDADFFGLGGTSLTATRLANSLSTLLFTDAALPLIFRSSTPRSLAAALIAREGEPGLTLAAAEQLEALVRSDLDEAQL